jgi:hypothetical protein
MDSPLGAAVIGDDQVPEAWRDVLGIPAISHLDWPAVSAKDQVSEVWDLHHRLIGDLLSITITNDKPVGGWIEFGQAAFPWDCPNKVKLSAGWQIQQAWMAE